MFWQIMHGNDYVEPDSILRPFSCKSDDPPDGGHVSKKTGFVRDQGMLDIFGCICKVYLIKLLENYAF